MTAYSPLKELGFSQYEAACYMALIAQHPVNGSQLSRISGIARSRIYDVLRNLLSKEYVIEIDAGQYAPLPPDELVKRLNRQFSSHIQAFEDQVKTQAQKDRVEYIWTITGYDQVLQKAVEMIKEAQKEIYVRIFSKAAQLLNPFLIEAEKKGVKIRYIAMGAIDKKFDIQVTHPDHETLKETIGGRSIDLIVDKKEALVGIFETGKDNFSPINWTRNQWFITANRDSLRHDFYHCFLVKIVDKNQTLSADEQRIYQIIKQDY